MNFNLIYFPVSDKEYIKRHFLKKRLFLESRCKGDTQRLQSAEGDILNYVSVLVSGQREAKPSEGLDLNSILSAPF